MTDAENQPNPDQDFIRSVWEEARDLIKRLEGSTVQRFSVEAAGTKIEIERAMATGAGAPVASVAAPAAAASVPGPSVEEVAETDGRHPIVAPLVGTVYRAGQPGADPFVKVGDSVEAGQTVAIVEAMKLMNQVQADIAGKVAEIVVEDGQWVEFEQPLMYLEPPEESE